MSPTAPRHPPGSTPGVQYGDRCRAGWCQGVPGVHGAGVPGKDAHLPVVDECIYGCSVGQARAGTVQEQCRDQCQEQCRNSARASVITDPRTTRHPVPDTRHPVPTTSDIPRVLCYSVPTLVRSPLAISDLWFNSDSGMSHRTRELTARVIELSTTYYILSSEGLRHRVSLARAINNILYTLLNTTRVSYPPPVIN